MARRESRCAEETGNSRHPDKGHSLRFVVADRFVVEAGSAFTPDLKILYTRIDKIDLGALEKLAPPPAE